MISTTLLHEIIDLIIPYCKDETSARCAASKIVFTIEEKFSTNKLPTIEECIGSVINKWPTSNNWNHEDIIKHIYKFILQYRNQTNSDEGCTCQECGNKYMVDIIVPDDIWEEIKPYGKPKGSGLLCGQCIFRKIENLKRFSSFQLLSQ